MTLATLLLAKGAQVPVSELIDAVWGARAPASAAGTLRTYVHHLRRALNPESGAETSVIRSVGRGYQLPTAQDAVDVAVFQRLVSQAEEAGDAGDMKGAGEHLRKSLRLWQGSALAGLRGDYADSQRHRLGEQRLSAKAMLMRTEIELGLHQQAAGTLVGLVRDHPLDERFWELFILALYRSGRQAAALAAYRQAQALLSDELGVDPGPALQTMYQRVLRADNTLLAAAVPRIEPEEPPHQQIPQQRLPQPQLPSQAPQQQQPAVGTPAQLPAGLATFVGRGTELSAALRLVAEGEAVVSVITGMAGVGKTAFAVHWARQVADHFPDGQIYINLRGFDQGGPPVRPEHALRTALEAMGADAGRLPQNVDTLSAMYRTWLAGKRVLLLLDNARDAAQVRSLLPGAPGCLAIVTSRHQMAGLVAVDGAQPVHLDVLSDAEARHLLTRRLGGARTAAEPEALTDIVAMCCRLPLALAITAARLATRPAMPLATMATDLQDYGGGLDAFRSGDGTADVRAAFSCSFHSLSPDAALIFRLLALHPGPDAALPAMAALAGFTIARTRDALCELSEAHLVEERLLGRFTQHDLLGAYASELLAATDSGQERDKARRRLLSYYLHSADNARQFFRSGRDEVDLPPVLPGIHIEKFGGERAVDEAKRWFNVEHAAIVACIGMASHHPNLDAYTWKLAWVIKQYLDRRARWREMETTHRAALESTLRLADPIGEACIRRGLARAVATLGRAEEARANMARSVQLYVGTGDSALSGEAHRQAGWLAERLGDIPGAMGHARTALELSWASGDPATAARCLNSVGWYHALLGDYEQALAHCTQALPLHRAAGDVCGCADTYDSIGYAYHRLGWYDQAVTAYQEALERYGSIDVLLGRGETLGRLGDVYMSMGLPWKAQNAWSESLDIFDGLGHRRADEIRERIAGMRVTA